MANLLGEIGSARTWSWISSSTEPTVLRAIDCTKVRRSFRLAGPHQGAAATAELGVELAQVVLNAVLEMQDLRVTLTQANVEPGRPGPL